MVKEMISGVLEDWLGEYILNISKENLKVAAVRGKIKLEDVELDGDLIGSHVLGAVGLSGFGVLSCWARSLRISIPWKSLEKSPTKLQIQGLHLICVPLLPSTSSKKCGPCTLRTRAKRSALARFERNFFSRRIPGEGPPSPHAGNAQQQQANLTWKQKLRARIFRNIQVSISTLHLRCEVPHNGLGFPGRAASTSHDHRAFSFGFTLGSLTINTATSTWQTGTINFDSNPSDPPSSENDKAARQTFKVLEVQSMAVYWDDNPPFLITHSAQMWWKKSLLADVMQVLMTTQDPGPEIRKVFSSYVTSFSKPSTTKSTPNIPHSYCCKPFSFKIRMTFSDSKGKQSFCHAELLPFHININLLPHQNRQYSKLRNIMISQQRIDTMLQQRPQQRPSANPKAWWRYAIACVITRPTSRPWRDVLRITKNRKRYIQIATKKILIQKQQNIKNKRNSLLTNGGYHGGLTEQESEELLTLEELLPIEALLSFHLIALRQVLEIQQQLSDGTGASIKTANSYNNSGHNEKRGKTSSANFASNSVTPLSPPRHKRHGSFGRTFRRTFSGKSKSKRNNSISNVVQNDDNNIDNDAAGDGMEVQLLSGLTSFDSGPISMSSNDENDSDQEQTKQHLQTFSLESLELQQNDDIKDATAASVSALEDNQQPMQIFFQLHDASAKMRLLMDTSDGGDNEKSHIQRTKKKTNIEPILQIELDTSGNARLRGGKNRFIFDVKRFEVFDCLMDDGINHSSPVNKMSNKIMTVRAISGRSSGSESHQRQAKKQSRSTGGGGVNSAFLASSGLRQSISTSDHDGDNFSGFQAKFPSNSSATSSSIATTPPELTETDMLELPDGVVCRVMAMTDNQSLNVMISAHPATLVWNKACLDAVNDFFSDPTAESQSILKAQLRNAATPLAHKAQLALMAPMAVSLKMCIDAPKLWIPVSSNRAADGALFLDAGKVKLAMSKQKLVMENDWQVNATDIQIKFVRGISPSSCNGFQSWLELDSPTAPKHNASAPFSESRSEIEIVCPFHVRVDASVVQEKEKHSAVDTSHDLVSSTSMTKVSLDIGKICLNFVDVEVLAKAIGKWYAAELLRVTGRSRTEGELVKTQRSRHKASTQERQMNPPLTSIPPCEINITIEKVEMALQGHSSEQTLASFPVKHKAYLIEIIGISGDWKRQAHQTISQLKISDASIAQAKDLLPLTSSTEPHHQMLVRSRTAVYSATNNDFLSSSGEKFSIPTPDAQMPTPPHQKHSRNSSFSDAQYCSVGASSIFTEEAPNVAVGMPPILHASHFHDRKNHHDEIEIDVESVLFRVTPTSLRDCSQGLRRIFELVQIMTKEMERRVHEEGRLARLKGKKPSRSSKEGTSRHSPYPLGQERLSLSSSNSESSNESTMGGENNNAPSDSSLLFKMTLKEATILMGTPAIVVGHSPTHQKVRHRNSDKQKGISVDVAVQVLANALIMFQSIENADASGKKTIHISINDLSSSVNTSFQPIVFSEIPPMIGPAAAECRGVYYTENLGSVISQDFSIDCDSIKSCLTPNDMMIISNVAREMIHRFGSFGETIRREESPNDTKEPVDRRSLPKANVLSSRLIQFKKKGTGIATKLRFELQTFSFVILRPLKSKYGARPFFDLNANQAKGKFDGCVAAMSGDCSATVSLNSFNNDISDWEYAVEPFQVVASIEQMPDELIVSLACPETICMNLTGVLLSDVAEMGFGFVNKTHQKTENNERCNSVATFPNSLTPSTTVGLRRATELNSVTLINESGIDFVICPMSEVKSLRNGKREIDQYHPSSFLVKDGSKVSLDSLTGGSGFQKLSGLVSHASASLALGIPPTAQTHIGKREDIFDLPVTANSGHSISLMKLQPYPSEDNLLSPDVKPKERTIGRSSPETVFSDASVSVQNEYPFYNVEPVVEWCMQNQRLRSQTTDVFSLERSKDILSSSTWSPGDEYFSPDLDKMRDDVDSEPAVVSAESSVSGGNWLRPYLRNDSPEWTDFTCILRMSRDRVMLPDDDWIWVNDWTVDSSGVYGESTDADGWEYEADFETFKRQRRFYQRGDLCRRRRWTRTRMVKPPRLDDPKRILPLVWETKREENGNFMLKIKSPLAIRNRTNIPLSIFAYSYSWDHDMLIGTVPAGGVLPVPIQLSTATYIRLAKKRMTDHAFLSKANTPLHGYTFSERLMILSTSYTSSKLYRTSIHNSEREESLKCHFVVEVKSVHGISEIVINPVLRVINLLPCQLLVAIGHAKRSYSKRPVINRNKITKIEELDIASTEEAKSISADCIQNKPHISFRVAGYKWSSWQRIVNRKANSFTWRPSEEEEEFLFQADLDDVDHAEEYKTIIRFDSLLEDGDPLKLIMSVKAGHVPTLRVYSQFWILNKSGFGLRFVDGFTDILGQEADSESLRASHLNTEDARSSEMKRDMKLPGHQWSFGMSGMSMYFSRKEKLALSIVSAVGHSSSASYRKVKSQWISPMDVSNVMPKTVFSVHEYDGPKQFEFALNVRLCPSVFSRTKLITIFPRYQILNLLDQDLLLAQDGWLEHQTSLPSKSSIPVHLEKSSLDPKIRFCLASNEKDDSEKEAPWTNGCIQLDKIGITSMRLPTVGRKKSLVVQAEVRLATKEQNSAVVVVLWSTNETSNPLYLLRNKSSFTIICSQPLNHEAGDRGTVDEIVPYEQFSTGDSKTTSGGILSELAIQARKQQEKTKNKTSEDFGLTGLECGTNIPVISGFLYKENREEFIWKVRRGEECCFGFDDPEKPHTLEWTCVGNGFLHGQNHMPVIKNIDENLKCEVATFEVDTMGTPSVIKGPNGAFVKCEIRAEHSTKVIEFVDVATSSFNVFTSNPLMAEMRVNYESMLQSEGCSVVRKDNKDEINEDDEFLAFTLRLDLPAIAVSVVDNVAEAVAGREILLLQMDSWMVEFSQSSEGYHELEMRLMSLQLDNHVHRAVHPVLIFCPRLDEKEPFLHMSTVRRLQPQSSAYVFRYAALRILEIDIFLDRKTAETIARFIQPLRKVKEEKSEDPEIWVRDITLEMEKNVSMPNLTAAGEVTPSNSDRIYFEELHLHPVRLSLTFTQEWMDWNPATEGLMIFQFIRGMASIANAPLTFTSFVVSHAFEAPEALLRIVLAHYSSQLTKQIFQVIGSLAILGAPADFLANVGTGVRDFFYEPINGLVHGPEQFIEGLEAGTQSLARGVFVGVVRGAANVTEVVNHNLAGLTADEVFIGERNAHQRMMTDAMSRGMANRTIGDSLYLAGGALARGVKSGAMGMVEQPAIYASKHGPVGLLKGVGKALVGAIVKPVVGVGDAAVLVMNHVSEATSDKVVLLKIPKRLRRALPRKSSDLRHSVQLVAYDERAAKAQKIVTGGESLDDVYVGHVNTSTHLIIASEQCLWIIEIENRDPWCLNWEEVSHFGMLEGGNMQITVFSQIGLKSHVFHVDSPMELAQLYQLLAMQRGKMGNCSSNHSDLDGSMFNGGVDQLFQLQIPGVKAKQKKHVFGSFNNSKRNINLSASDEIEVIEQCFTRVKKLGSDKSSFFESLDEEAWALVYSWGQVFSGLSSRRCIAAGIINGTGANLQIKSTKLLEGGSPCYSIPTMEYNQDQDLLYPGGAIILFGWGVVPNLLQDGRVFMNIETNAFMAELSVWKNQSADSELQSTHAQPMPGYQVGFLEKSYDDSGWWAKYWLLVRKI